MSSESLRDLAYSLSSESYIRSLGFKPYTWQIPILQSLHPGKLINGARQSGKSTLISGKPAHRACFFPGSMAIVIAATEKQATEDMEKIKDFIAHDPYYPRIVRDSDSLLETIADPGSWWSRPQRREPAATPIPTSPERERSTSSS